MLFTAGAPNREASFRDAHGERLDQAAVGSRRPLGGVHATHAATDRGVIAGVAGPLAATAVAQAGIGGVGGIVLEGTLAPGINFAAGSLGTVANSYVATGQPPSGRDYLLGGLTGVFVAPISNVAFRMGGVNHVSQLPLFTPRSLRGVFGLRPNSRALWGAALLDALAGAVLGADQIAGMSGTGMFWTVEHWHQVSGTEVGPFAEEPAMGDDLRFRGAVAIVMGLLAASLPLLTGRLDPRSFVLVALVGITLVVPLWRYVGGSLSSRGPVLAFAALLFVGPMAMGYLFSAIAIWTFVGAWVTTLGLMMVIAARTKGG